MEKKNLYLKSIIKAVSVTNLSIMVKAFINIIGGFLFKGLMPENKSLRF